MTEFMLGMNTCFAVKRWPEADEWARIVAEDFGLKMVQFSFDLMDPRAGAGVVSSSIDHTRIACERFGITIHSTFTGFLPFMQNLLLHPEPAFREDAKAWFKAAIDATARMKVPHMGGYFGALSMKDVGNQARRQERMDEWLDALRELAQEAKDKGLESLLIEPMAGWREPPTGIGESLALAAMKTAVPLRIAIDLGHMVVKGREGDDLDPYAWLRKVSPKAGCIHVQQSNDKYDLHQPFTPETNKTGRIDPKKAVEAIKASGAEKAVLIFEIVHACEEDEKQVIADIKMSVDQWREAIK
ncbi:MAG: sugar phosphate isomerase/epimerase [Planctomycetota bacterium]|nr:MAG: sugar phosphate isomerase/epimerase [Planctomycetota bacterium]